MASVNYSDLGKQAKDLLYGGKTGVFQFDKKLAISTKTSEGVLFSLNGVLRSDQVIGDLKASYILPQGVLIDTVLKSDSKASFSATLPNLAQGLGATISASVPNIQNSGKVQLDYKIPNIGVKAGVSLTANPLVDLSIAAGNGQYLVGGDVLLDSGAQALRMWSAGIGYFGQDFQVSTQVFEQAKSLKVNYSHRFTPLNQIGAEFQYNIETKKTGLILAYASVLQSGALTKFRIDDQGLVSVVYQQSLDKFSNIGLSGQFDASNQKAAKFGVALEINN